jgi:hypothetical protein
MSFFRLVQSFFTQTLRLARVRDGGAKHVDVDVPIEEAELAESAKTAIVKRVRQVLDRT